GATWHLDERRARDVQTRQSTKVERREFCGAAAGPSLTCDEQVWRQQVVAVVESHRRDAQEWRLPRQPPTRAQKESRAGDEGQLDVEVRACGHQVRRAHDSRDATQIE